MAVSTWTTKHQNDLAALPSTIKAAKSFYQTHGDALRTYSGGMPAGVLAAIATKESNGRMIAGDASLGEYGFFQITENFPRTIGLSPDLRKSEVGNIFLAGIEYNIEARRMKLRYPELVESGSVDQWMLARAVFALGIGAVTNLIKLVRPSRYGKVFEDLLHYAEDHPDLSVSGYEVGKVWYRLKSVPLLWRVGAEVGSSSPGEPVRVPAPPGLSYDVPKDVRPYMTEPSSNVGMALLALMGGAGLYLLLTR